MPDNVLQGRHDSLAPPQMFIEGTEAGSRMLLTAYPDHIYDPVRRQIATEITGKEIAKLVMAPGKDVLEEIRQRIDGMFDAQSIFRPPVREFWTLFDMMTKLKTKRLGRFITASNVAWSQAEVELDGLDLSWMPFIEERQEIFGSKPWPIGRLREGFDAHPSVYAEALASNARNLGQYSFERTEEPIIILEGEADKLLLDGNGRLYAALMAGKTALRSWVGRMEGPKPVDFWVSPATLTDLIDEVLDGDTPIMQAAALDLLKGHLATNRVALVNYQLWLRKEFPQLEEALATVLPSKPASDEP